MQPFKGLEPLTIGEGEIRQNHVESLFIETLQSVGQALDVGEFKVESGAFAQQQSKQARIDRAVFNEQNFDRWIHDLKSNIFVQIDPVWYAATQHRLTMYLFSAV